MSMTELERHLLDGLEKMRQEVADIQKKQDVQLQQLSSTLSTHAKSIQQLSEFYKDLEPLLQRLNVILENEV